MSEDRQLQRQILAYFEDRSSATFDQLALACHAHQKRHCPALRAYSETVCASPARWQDIPPIPTDAFKSESAPICTVSPDEAAATFRTSGTTGESRGEHHFPDLELYEASIRDAWQQLDLPDLPLLCLSHPPTVAPDSSLVHMFATLGGRFLLGSTGELVPERIEALLTNTHRPVLLAGTALAFLNWFEQSGATPALPPGSYALETGGYKGSGREISKPELYGLFEAHLGLPAERIINEYSMTELSSQFYTHGLGRPHRGPHWLRARVLRPGSNEEVDNGETGLLAIYDLANLGSSLAIMTRDLAVRRGRDFELVGRDPAALPRGCSRSADELIRSTSAARPK